MANIKYYGNKKIKEKEIVFYDPDVYSLRDGNEYPKIKLLHEIASGVKPLKKNEYISIDYPCDMNLKFQVEFIRKTVENNIKYANNRRYICTIQSKFKNIKDFRFNLYKLEDIWSNTGKILGIGNLCRIIYPNKFMDMVFTEMYKIAKKVKQFHFYGLSIRNIKRYIPRLLVTSDVSVDSTKWTRAVDNSLRIPYGLQSTSSNRQEFFERYIYNIEKMTNIKILW